MRKEYAVRDAPDAPRPADFEWLWRNWRPRAAAYCRAFPSITRETREELASEAVLRAYRASGRFIPGKPFAPWFFAIVRNLAIDELARLPRECPRGASVEEAPSRHEEAEERAEKACEEAFVKDFLGTRDNLDRELANLVYGQGLGAGEAAKLVGVPAGTAKWRLFELRAALRRAWEREYGHR